ncbi:MAG: hypothetical protein KDC16_12420 [Saprospiraceae bacterium]|nr:hypothetical protein [Saprospiraceae bacterium]
MRIHLKFEILMVLIVAMFACKQVEKPQVETAMEGINENVVEKVNYGTIYEVNVRQYTPEGTFEAFKSHIPRLKELGVKVLWMMPLQEIGVENRKGDRGSYYSIRDYRSVNHEYGTVEDLKTLVDEIHKNDMAVILDWVGNHTAWDHYWMKDRPDFYTHDESGKVIPPVADWTDVADLNYDVPDLRDSMLQNMMYWVDSLGFDGFRCDVAGMVPVEFWQSVRAGLDKRGDYFLLAEAEEEKLHDNAFMTSYGWHFHFIMNEVAQGKKGLDEIRKYLDDHVTETNFNRMHFTSNHDENTWKGNAIDRMGKDYENMAVLSFTIPGIPLIYSGQETGLHKDLMFFDKDTIEWKNDSPFFPFFKNLVSLRKNQKVLWTDNIPNSFSWLENENPDVLAFGRHLQSNDENDMMVYLNYGDEKIELGFPKNVDMSKWKSWDSEDVLAEKFSVDGNGYKIFIKR